MSERRIAAALDPIVPAGGSILVGFSGGMDSVALLHLLAQLAPRHCWKLSALHVHHGISANADAWADFCVETCAKLGVPLRIERVNIEPLRAMGVEAAARKLRHEALARCAVDFIALAHHQDDQAETLLLQLLRGAGVKGAAAMPGVRKRDGAPTLLRPLLDISRADLLGYAQANGLQWIEDESNADQTYPRNFLRHQILPLLAQRFPASSATLARSARHFAEAAQLLDDLARQDAGDHSLSPCGRGGGECLAISRLHSLPLPRARNLLRWFLHQNGAPMPHAAQLDELLHQLLTVRNDAAMRMVCGGWEVRRHKGNVHVFPARPAVDAALRLEWRGEAVLRLPEWGGALHFESCIGNGISREKLNAANVSVRLRQGGERLRPHEGGATRTLKNLMQEHGIPPWQRDRLPLLFCADTLIAVPGIGVDDAYRAAPQEAGVVLRWERDPARTQYPRDIRAGS